MQCMVFAFAHQIPTILSFFRKIFNRYKGSPLNGSVKNDTAPSHGVFFLS